jgi:hypothetical protein
MGAEIRKRELLYTEFIAECARLAIDAFGHTLERPETVLPAYALLNRIRLTSSDAVLAAAEQTVKNIAEQYFARPDRYCTPTFRGVLCARGKAGSPGSLPPRRCPVQALQTSRASMGTVSSDYQSSALTPPRSGSGADAVCSSFSEGPTCATTLHLSTAARGY